MEIPWPPMAHEPPAGVLQISWIAGWIPKISNHSHPAGMGRNLAVEKLEFRDGTDGTDGKPIVIL